MRTNATTDLLTGSNTLEQQPRVLILPPPPLCHVSTAASEEPSDWWEQFSVKSVSFKDEWWLLIVFI